MVLRTHADLETIMAWKKEIRDHIGESFYSIHINDYHKQTIETARAVFNLKETAQ